MKSESRTINFIIAVIAVVGMLCIALVLRFSMLMMLILIWPVVLFIFVLYFYSSFQTFFGVLLHGVKANRLKLIFHISFIIIAGVLYISSTEIVKSKIVLAANYNEDLFSYWLKFRENGTCENYIIGFGGYEEIIKGKYRLEGDTIVFSKIPYRNEHFITDTMFIDRGENIIYTNKEHPNRFKITIDNKEEQR